VQASDFGFSCGTARFDWHSPTAQATFVKRGEYACVVLLSNKLSRELLDLAFENRWTLSETYARTHARANASSSGGNVASLSADALKLLTKRFFPVAARAISTANPLFKATEAFGKAVVEPLGGAFVVTQYTQKRACAQFIVDVDSGKLRAKWSIVYNPRVSKTVGETYASVWQSDDGKAVRKVAPLRCGVVDGSVLHGRGDSIFSGGTSQLVAP